MIEFTILLDDDPLEFEPHQYAHKLQLFMPPTARIGHKRKDDVVHLAPIPVHCFFNAIAFGHWLQERHKVSENDAFVVYVAHDMFKALLRLILNRDGKRTWWHQREPFFDPIENKLKASKILDQFDAGFIIAAFHNQSVPNSKRSLFPEGRVGWREAVTPERELDAGIEDEDGRYEFDWPMIGLTIRLQSALSNVAALAYVKQLFVQAYVQAIRAEFSDVFKRYDAVSYRYKFVDPATLSGNPEQDIQDLCSQSDVHIEDRTLAIETFIGTHPATVGDTVIRLPFWLLLTLRQDQTSILFPVPMHHDGHPDPNNEAFVHRVRQAFNQAFKQLLESAQPSGSAEKRWTEHIAAVTDEQDPATHEARLNQVCCVYTTTDYDQAIQTRVPQSPTTFCTMCGSEIPDSFACSPERDMGASVSNYTDWHLGSPDQACVLCAISHFKAPPALEQAHALVFQRKLVYFTVNNPAAQRLATMPEPKRLFFDPAVKFDPQLSVASLESLVTLNIVAALYLHDTRRRVVVNHIKKGHPILWLEPVNADPFTFIGLIGSDQGKGALVDLLGQLQALLNRPIHLLDALLPMDIEVPYQSLINVLGVSKGRHFQLKFKPLTSSNHQGALPVVWEGYHLLDTQALAAARQLADFVAHFPSQRVKHRTKLVALASGPAEFMDLMVELGGYGYEGLLDRLQTLSGGQNPEAYLLQLKELVHRYPIMSEIWEK